MKPLKTRFGNANIADLYTLKKLIFHLTIGRRNIIVLILQQLCDFGKVFFGLQQNTRNLIGNNVMFVLEFCLSMLLANIPAGALWRSKWNVEVVRGCLLYTSPS